MDVRALLDRIVIETTRRGIPLGATLKPGLTTDEIRTRTKGLRFPLHEDLVLLFEYCDGMGWSEVAELLPAYRLLPLEEAMETYQMCASLNQPGFNFRPSELFPFLSFDSNVFWIWCGAGSQRGQVHHSHKETFPLRMFDRITDFLGSIEECFLRGIYKLESSRLEGDEHAEWEVRARHARARAGSVLGRLELGAVSFADEQDSLDLAMLADERFVPSLRPLLARSLAKARPDPGVRSCLIALGRLKSQEAFDLLTEAAHHPNWTIRTGALEGLIATRSPLAVPIILKSLREGVPGDEHATGLLRNGIAFKLRGFVDPRILDACLEHLTSGSPTLQLAAASILGGQKALAAVAPLCRSLLANSSQQAMRSARALGELGDASAVPELLGALDRGVTELAGDSMAARRAAGSPNSLAFCAAQALAKLDAPSSVPSLGMLLDDLLRELGARQSSELLLALTPTIAEVCGCFRSHSDVAPERHLSWLKLLESVQAQGHQRWMIDAARVAHVAVLAHSDTERAREAVRTELATGDGQLRRQLTASIASGSAKWASAALEQGLVDAEPTVREEAAKGLAFKPSADARPALELALEDENGVVRWWSARALAVIGSPQSAAVFAESVQDPNLAVAAVCIHALHELEPSRAVSAIGSASLSRRQLLEAACRNVKESSRENGNPS